MRQTSPSTAAAVRLQVIRERSFGVSDQWTRSTSVETWSFWPCDRLWGVDSDHHDTSGQDTGRVPMTRRSFLCRKRLCLELGGGRLRMAGKALESFPTTWYSLSTYPWDPGAKSSTTSEQTASWLSGYPCGVQHDRRLQGCSAVRRRGGGTKYGSIPPIVLHT